MINSAIFLSLFIGQLDFLLPGSDGASSFAISEDNNQILATGYLVGGQWGLWDYASRKRTSIGEAKVSGGHAAAFALDGKSIIIGGDADIVADVPHGELRIFDRKSGVERASFSGHRAAVTQLAVLNDRKHLVSLSDDSTIRVWTIGDQVPVSKFCFLGMNPKWKCYEDQKSEKAPLTKIIGGPSDKPYGFAICPSSHHIAVASATQTIRFIHPISGKIQRTFNCKYIKNAVTVAISKKGSLLAVGGANDDAIVELWDFEKVEFLGKLEGHSSTILTLDFDTEHKRLASGGVEDGLRVWDLSKLKETCRFLPGGPDRLSTVRSARFMGNDRLIAVKVGGPVTVFRLPISVSSQLLERE